MTRSRLFFLAALGLLMWGGGVLYFRPAPRVPQQAPAAQASSGQSASLAPGLAAPSVSKSLVPLASATPVVVQADPIHSQAAFLKDAVLLETRIQALPGNQTRTLKLYRQPAFKYPLVREVQTTTASGTQRYLMVGDHALMKFPAAMAAVAVIQWADRLGWTVRKSLHEPGLFVVAARHATAETVDQLMAAHASDFPPPPGNSPVTAGAYAEPDYLQFTTAIPNDTNFLQLWGLHNTGQSGGVADADIDAPEGWEYSTGSNNVVVGVIDSGVDVAHPDLAANVNVNAGEIPGNDIDDDQNGFIDDVRGWDFYGDDEITDDPNGHGTHVSGTIGAAGNNGVGVVGVAWRVSLLPLRFLGPSGSGVTSDAAEAVRYATARRVLLTSNSWGGGGFSQTLNDAISAADSAGILFVAAAGNDASNTDGWGFYPSGYTQPNIIAVASTTRMDSLSSFSNYGLTSVDLAAPGSDVYSTLPSNSYGTKSGTSMAAPHVSGALALMKATAPRATAAQIKQSLLASATPLASLSGRCVTGGRLNLAAALGDVRKYSTEATEFTVDDTGTGNGDGIVNPGEEFRLRFKVVNHTSVPSTALTATLVLPAGSAYTLVTPSHLLGDIPPASEVLCTTLSLRAGADVVTPSQQSFTLALTYNSPGVSASQPVSLPIESSSTISGMVTDAASGEPVAGVTIVYDGAHSGTISSGADGRYDLTIGDGVHTLHAQGANYTKSITREFTTPPSHTGVDFAMGRSQLVVTPSFINERLVTGDQVTRHLHIANPGTAPLEWEINAGEIIQAAPSAVHVGLLSNGYSFSAVPAAYSGSYRNLAVPLTSAVLSELTILMVDQNLAQMGKPADFALIRKAVQNGMGLVVSSSDYELEKLTSLLLGSGIDLVWGSVSGTLTDMRPHPTTVGVNSLFTDSYYGGLLCKVSAHAVPLVLKPDGVVVCAASTLGRGRVLAVGPGLFGYNASYGDGKRFVSQSVKWVSRPDSDWLSLPQTSGIVLPGEAVDVPVILSALFQTPQTFNGDLNITTNAPVNGSAVVDATLTVREGGGLVAIGQQDLTFGEVNVGYAARRSITLLNSGSKNVIIRGVTMPSVALTADQTFPITLKPAEAIAVPVDYAPREVGSLSGDLAFISDDETTRLLRLPVAGSAVPTADITVSPAAVSFTLIHGERKVVPLTVTNTGPVPVSYTVSPGYHEGAISTLSKTSGTLAAGASEEVEVTVVAKSYNWKVPAIRLGISFSSQAPGRSYATATLAFKVVAGPVLELTPAELDLGEQSVGFTAGKMLFLKNAGNESLVVQGIDLPSAAWQTSITFPFTMLPTSSQAVPIQFAPAAAGNWDGNVVLRTTDSIQPQRTIPVRGVGIAAPAIAVSPASLSFTAASGQVSPAAGRVITISNPGASPLQWRAYVADPAAPALEETLTRLNGGYTGINSLIPQRYDFAEGDTGSSFTSSGGMFNGGNSLTASNKTLPYTSGTIADSPSLGANGRYFTCRYPGLFVFAGDLSIPVFGIRGYPGYLSSRSSTEAVLTSTVAGKSFTGFVKRSFGTYSATVPTINHLFIVESKSGQGHNPYGAYNDNHDVNGMSGDTRLYYLMFGGTNNRVASDAEMQAIMDKFLAAIHGKSAAWLPFQPVTGTLAPGQSTPVTVSAIVPPGLGYGSHSATVTIAHNAPTPAVSVPVTLQHNSVPSFTLAGAPTAVNFGSVSRWTTAVRNVTLTNLGPGTGQITGISFSNPAFRATLALPREVWAGTVATLPITFAPTQVRAEAGTVTFTTNDPANPTFVFSLAGVGAEAPFVVVEPSDLVINVPAGRTGSGALSVLNYGGGSFNWSATSRLVRGYEPPPGNTGIAAAPLSLEEAFTAINNSNATITGALVNRYNFSDGVTGSSITDGGGDMFDNGNQLWTNLTKSAPLTYTGGTFKTEAGLGAGGRYFTHRLNGLFILGADISGLSEFRIAGGLGADGEGSITATKLTATVYGRSYTGFVKRVHGAGTDPSVNHLIIVESKVGQDHDYANTTDDDAHRVFGIEGATRLYYLLYAGTGGSIMNDAQTLNLMTVFLSSMGPTMGAGVFSIAPASGIVNVLPDSDTITATVNASQLLPGSYKAVVEMSTSLNFVTTARNVTVNVLAAPLIAHTPATLTFPETFQGQQRELLLTVANNGTAPLTVTGAAMPSPAFATTAGFPITIPVGGSAGLPVSFAPATIGAHGGNLVIASNDPAVSALAVPVVASCVGTPVFNVDVDHLEVSLPAGSSRTRSLTLANTGTGGLVWSIREIDLSLRDSLGGGTNYQLQPASGVGASVTLAAGAASVLTVNIPAPSIPGDYTAAIRFETSELAANSVHIIPVTLEVTHSSALKVTTPSSPGSAIDFGQVSVPAAKVVNITLRNDGSEPVVVTALNLPAGFKCTAALPLTLTSGAAHSIPIEFLPTVDGVLTGASLEIVSNDAIQPQLLVPIVAEGVLPPVLTAAPSEISFNLGMARSETKLLRLGNSGGRPGAWTATSNTGGLNGTPSALPVALSAINASATALSAAIPLRYNFSGGGTGISIEDGGSDMYDGGNYIDTNFFNGISYLDNVVGSSSSFGSNGRYFTRKLNGLFILAADINNVSTFGIRGNLGADGSGTVEGSVLTATSRGTEYKGYLKRVFGAGDPSVNHLIIVRSTPGVNHTFATNSNDDRHTVSGLNGVTRLYYLLYAGTGTRIDDAAALNLMKTFLDAIPLGTPDWLTITPSSGTAPGSSFSDISLTAKTFGLPAGQYEAVVSISSPSQATPIAVPVALQVSNPDFTLGWSSDYVNTIQGANAHTRSLPLTAAADVAWSSSADVAWLSLSPAAGVGSASLGVHFDVSGLPVGTHQGKVTFTSALGERVYTVSVGVTAPNIIQLVPDPTRPVAYALHRYNSAALLKVDSTTGAFLDWIHLGSDSVTFDLDASGSCLYMVRGGSRVDKLDPVSLAVIESKYFTHVSGADQIHSLTPGKLLVRSSGSLSLVDYEAGTSRMAFQRPATNVIDSVVPSPDGQTLWAWSNIYTAGVVPWKILKLKAAPTTISIAASNSKAVEDHSMPVATGDGKVVFFGNRRFATSSLVAPSGDLPEAARATNHDGSYVAGTGSVMNGSNGAIVAKLSSATWSTAAFALDDTRLLHFAAGDSAVRVYNGAQISVFDGDGEFATELADGQVQPVILGSLATQDDIVHTFTIRNTGWTTLSNLVVTAGSGAAAQMLIQQPAQTMVPAGQSTTFTVTLQPSAIGSLAAQLHIASSDPNHPSFDFPVAASITAAAEVPAITQQPQPRVIEMGESVNLQVAATGTTPMTCQWYLGDKAIAGATGFIHKVVNADSSKAGIYTVRVSNTAGNALSANCPVGVYSPVASESTPNERQSITITGRIFGSGLTFQWRKDDVEVTSEPAISGLNSPALTINPLPSSASGFYTLTASVGTSSRTILRHRLSLRCLPVIAPQLLVSWAVGVKVDFVLDASHAPTRFIAAGLPPGLTINAVTGRVTGLPRAAGTYTLRFAAANGAGTGSEWTTPVQVDALEPEFIGNFEGIVERRQGEWDLGGRVSWTVASSGGVSGTLIYRAFRVPFSGNLEWHSGESLAYARIPLNSVNFPGYALTLVLGKESPVCRGEIYSGYDSVKISAVRCVSSAGALAGRYNVLLDLPEVFAGLEIYPQGNGYGQLVVANTGLSTWSGKLADGNSTTLSTRLGRNGLIPLYLADPAPVSSAALGWLDLSLTPGTGTLAWMAHSYSTGRIYWAGIPPHDQRVHFERYLPPQPKKLLFNLPDVANNAILSIVDFAYSGAPASPQAVRITSAHGAIFPAPNSSKFTLSLNAATGLFSGSFRYGKSTPTFSGILLPSLGQGAGFTLLSQDATSTTAPLHSIQVLLAPPSPLTP